ncbi:uncharacterized protein VTP21DRAFT_8215 [Calcarisporiella thermophila]|uniref:uncharacterized protein n=1 Tax=Calcarisporiella thermophila TaxID=911321 RepID=UPI003743127A
MGSDFYNDANIKSISTYGIVLLLNVLKLKVSSVDLERGIEDEENAFFVADLGETYRLDRLWKEKLPRIDPFFAVKVNPDPMVLRLLATLGNGFDCASKDEIQKVLDLGVDPSRIIYANPCKQASYIRYAARVRIKMLIFDNLDELLKIARYHPRAELLLRILIDDSKSKYKLGKKFGAPLDSTQALLRSAKELGLSVVGVCFHVGSDCHDSNAFVDAVKSAREVFDQALALGFQMSLLDVGGGFPNARVGEGSFVFNEIANVLKTSVEEYFPSPVRVIAEPGRYYVSSAFTLATSIIARRTTQDDEMRYLYYINDGTYGNLWALRYDEVMIPRVLQIGKEFVYNAQSEKELGIEYSCSVWGPTCDSVDCVIQKCLLPLLNVGDWLYY